MKIKIWAPEYPGHPPRELELERMDPLATFLRELARTYALQLYDSFGPFDSAEVCVQADDCARRMFRCHIAVTVNVTTEALV